jgi:glycine betaine/choline ABC-type transport system substrate-binding protein
VAIFQLGTDTTSMDRLRNGADLNSWLKQELGKQHHLEWMPTFGFSNAYTLIVRADDPRFENVQTMSQLAELLRR